MGLCGTEVQMGRPTFGCLAVQKENGLKIKTKTEGTQFSLIRCWTNSFPCRLSRHLLQITDLQSEHFECVFERW